LNLQPSAGLAQGTAFTCQGRLNEAGTAANGSNDARLLLFDVPTAGGQISTNTTSDELLITDTLFRNPAAPHSDAYLLLGAKHHTDRSDWASDRGRPDKIRNSCVRPRLPLLDWPNAPDNWLSDGKITNNHDPLTVMKTRLYSALAAITALQLSIASSSAQLVDPYYAGHYSIRSLASVATVPRFYGGVVILTNNPNVLLIAGACESAAAKIYQVGVQRDGGGHITNFTGTPTVLANTPGFADSGDLPWTGLSGDWDFGPGGVLFYISGDNYLGQIKPGFANPAKFTDLSAAAGLAAGTVVSVPPGLPGAGRFKLGTRGHQFWYDVPLTSDGAGTYNPGAPTKSVELEGTAIIGAAYVPAGAPLFTNHSVVICDVDKLRTYSVDANGDPMPGSGRVFVSGLASPEGISRDPVTGDFLFVSLEFTPGFFVVGNFTPAAPPTVTLVAPTNGAHFAAPAGFDVHAEANAPGGTIANVQFYQNSNPIGTLAVPPFTVVVSGLTAGIYSYLAVVTDGIGRMATSSVASVTVTNPTPNAPPTVSLTYPPSNSVFRACTLITLAATASDSDGDVASVAFYDGATRLGQVPLPPYRWPVLNLAGGLHLLTAQATDDRGVVTTSAVVTVTIVPPPSNHLAGILNTNREFEGCFCGAPGSNYVLLTTTNLNQPIAWVRRQTNSSPTGVMRFVDPTATNTLRSFYRTQLVP
jgi:hypothetical protein